MLGADAVTVSPYLGEEAIAPLLARERPVRLRPVPDLEPGRGRAPGARGGRRTRGVRAPAEPLWARVARRAAAWGPGGTVGLVVGATAPDELARDPRASRRAWRSSCPGVGAQGGEVEPVLADGPATAAPAGGRPGGGLLVNVSRGIARAALEAPAAGSPADPGERLAEAAAEWAERLACATLTPFRDGPSRPGPCTRSIHDDAVNIGPGELIIILVIALIVVGPGKLPGRRGRRSARASGVPQGRHRRQGRGQPRRSRAGRVRAAAATATPAPERVTAEAAPNTIAAAPANTIAAAPVAVAPGAEPAPVAAAPAAASPRAPDVGRAAAPTA